MSAAKQKQSVQKTLLRLSLSPLPKSAALQAYEPRNKFPTWAIPVAFFSWEYCSQLAAPQHVSANLQIAKTFMS
ncbi:hypothetical protein AOLI_G00075920 [Acnodon oligacanthus]